jgi:hypothetical protein
MALRIQLGLAGLVVLGVFVQVYLIASYIFGADTLDAHKSIGLGVHAVEVLVLIAALFAKNERLLSLGLAVIGTIQIALSDADEYVGGLHGLFALFVLVLAGMVIRRSKAVTT